jgi:hypothetical protein
LSRSWGNKARKDQDMYKCMYAKSRPSGLPEEACATPPSRLFSAKKDASDPSRQSQGRRRRKSHQSSRLSALVLLVRSVSALFLLGTFELVPGDVGWSTPTYPHPGTHGWEWSHISPRSRRTQERVRRERRCLASPTRDPLWCARREESEVELAHEPQGCLARTASHRG